MAAVLRALDHRLGPRSPSLTQMQAAQQRDGPRDVVHDGLTRVDEGHPARDGACLVLSPQDARRMAEDGEQLKLPRACLGPRTQGT